MCYDFVLVLMMVANVLWKKLDNCLLLHVKVYVKSNLKLCVNSDNQADLHACVNIYKRPR